MIWVDLARDAVGVLIFLAWLAIPPAHVMILGRHYVRRFERELEHAESYVDQVDDELAKLPRQGSGRHRLNR